MLCRLATIALAACFLAASPAPAQTLVTPSPSAAAGIALPLQQSSAAESSHVFKTAAGNIYLVGAVNTGNSGFILLIDGTTVPGDGALTACGTTNPNNCLRGCWPIAGGSATAPAFFGFQMTPGPPVSLSNGMVMVYSSTGCTTKTLGGSNIFFEAQVD